MEYMIAALVALNIATALYAYHKLKQAKKGKYDKSAEELLQELFSPGGAVLRVELLDKANIFLRSPKDL